MTIIKKGNQKHLPEVVANTERTALTMKVILLLITRNIIEATKVPVRTQSPITVVAAKCVLDIEFLPDILKNTVLDINQECSRLLP
jgi:hypothetical protein